MNSPNTIIFDLDDTLIMSDGTVEKTWQEVCDEFSRNINDLSSEQLYQEIRKESIWYWGDKTRHRLGRINMTDTRREIVKSAFKNLGLDHQDLAIQFADEYSKRRMEVITIFPGVYEVLDLIKQKGIKTGLLTNGEHQMQQEKVDKFKLAPYFDVIQIEGAVGFGKPEKKSYLTLLKSLEADISTTWIVGDNLEWEVQIPQSLGLTAIWMNYYKREIENDAIKPDKIIHQITEIIDWL